VAAGGASTEGEGDPEGDCRDGIAEVVDGIREERHRAGDNNDEHLEGRRYAKPEEREFDGLDALRGTRECVIDAVGGVVAVRAEDAGEEAANAFVVGMEVTIVPWVLMVVGCV
jgi:hypothetical protein